MAQALYRKWRSQAFAELVGQEPITRTLRNAVASGRTTHAYLFCGPRGTGKTSTGRILAKALNCLNPTAGEPCNECRMCTAITEGRLMDLIEIDAASNRGIDEIRDLRDKIRFAPTEAKYKVYIVDEVHMLTDQAFNALLKTLEEPPPHAVFILATTEAHKLPATIVSRCQRFDFRRIRPDAAIGRLREISDAEGIEIDDLTLAQIARNAGGSLRDAENLLDQLVSFYGNRFGVAEVRELLGLAGDERSRAVAEAALTGDLAGGFQVISDVLSDGVDLRQFNREVVETLRRVMLIQVGAGRQVDVGDEERAALQQLADAAVPDRVVQAVRSFSEVDLRNDALASLPIELALFDAINSRLEPANAAAPSEPHVRKSPINGAVGSAPVARPPSPADPRGESVAVEPRPAAPFVPTGDLATRWRDLRDRIKAIEPGLAGLLVTCRPATIESDEVAVSINSAPNHQRIEKVRARIEAVLLAVYGQPVRFVCQLKSGTGPADRDTPAPSMSLDPREELIQGTLVQHAIKAHKARISLEPDEEEPQP